MAVTVTNRTSGGQASASTSISTGTVSPAANTILAVAVIGRRSTGPSQPTVSGLSLSWTHVAGTVFATSRRLDVFWALVGGSPGAGALTFDWGETHDAVWAVDEVADADSDGPVQSATATATATTVSAALAALRDSQSLVWAAFGGSVYSYTWSPEGGATETADTAGTNTLIRVAAHHKTGDATVTGTVSTSSTVASVAVEFGIAANIKAGKASAPLRASGERGSGGIVMAKTGAGRAALRAAGYKMPVAKSGAGRAALKASGSYLERDVGVTKHLEAAILAWLFNGATLTPPASLYLGLFTAAPDVSAGGTECSGGGYGRARFANAAGSWADAAAGSKALVTCVGFPVASGSWGTVTAIGIFDAASGGNLWTWRPVSPSMTITSGETVVVEPNDLVVALD